MWEQFPEELCVRVIRREGRKRTEHAIALAGVQQGFAFYEDPRAFDAMWSGEGFSIDGFSVVMGEGGAPVVTRIVASQAMEPRREDLTMALAVMKLLIKLVSGGPDSQAVRPGVSLSLRRETAKKRSS